MFQDKKKQCAGWKNFHFRIREREYAALMQIANRIGARPLLGCKSGNLSVGMMLRGIAIGFYGLVETKDFKHVVYIDRQEELYPWRKFGKKPGEGKRPRGFRFRHGLAAAWL